jgi:Zn-dependent peptidase ImmA (M78 family)
MTPPSSQLFKLARACGIRTEYFFRTHEVELLECEFHKLATFGKAAQEVLKIKIANMVEKRIELLGHFPESPIQRFKPPGGLPRRVTALDQLEEFADQVRNAWKLGLNPIADLTDALETLGLLVIVVDEGNPGFSGLAATARAADGRIYPVIAVSSRWPGDRQRFTLAHELGHLLLAGRLGAEVDEEQACDRFAGAFLAPKAAVLLLLGQARRDLEWQELYALKHEFGLSMVGWLQRAKQCGVITEAVHLALSKRLSAKGWRKNEPGEPASREHPRLFEQLIYRALGEQYISESKAAELLGIPMMRFYKERQLECLDDAHQ